MRSILKYVVLILAISVLTSCTTHYTMRGDTFTVVEESTYYPDSLSMYILEYKDNRTELIEKIERVFSNNNMLLPTKNINKLFEETETFNEN